MSKKTHEKNLARAKSKSNQIDMGEFERLTNKLLHSPLGGNTLLVIEGKKCKQDNQFHKDDEGVNLVCPISNDKAIFMSIHNNVLRQFDLKVICHVAYLTCEEYFEILPLGENNYCFKLDEEFTSSLTIRKVA
jgi:hypothetical protein